MIIISIYIYIFIYDILFFNHDIDGCWPLLPFYCFEENIYELAKFSIFWIIYNKTHLYCTKEFKSLWTIVTRKW